VVWAEVSLYQTARIAKEWKMFGSLPRLLDVSWNNSDAFRPAAWFELTFLKMKLSMRGSPLCLGRCGR